LDVVWEADFNLEFNWPREERRVPAEALQNLGLTPKIALLDSVSTGSLDFGFAIKFNVIGLDAFKSLGGSTKEDKYDNYVSNFIKEISIHIKVREEINIGMQLEVVVQGGLEMFCPFWIVPFYPWIVPGGCELVASEANITARLDDGWPKKFDQKTWDKVKDGKPVKEGRNNKAWKVSTCTFRLVLRPPR
jgi:hypothetical protein